MQDVSGRKFNLLMVDIIIGFESDEVAWELSVGPAVALYQTSLSFKSASLV